MKITIVSQKKVKQDFYQKAIEEYTKRLSRYCKLNFTSSVPSSLLQKEHCLSIYLTEEKNSPSSETFSFFLSEQCISGISHFLFFIDEAPFNALPLSLSKLPISRELKTVLLLEQLYRSFRIRNNEPYHK